MTRRTAHARPPRPWFRGLLAGGVCALALSTCAAPLLTAEPTTIEAATTDGVDGEGQRVAAYSSPAPDTSDLIGSPQLAPPRTPAPQGSGDGAGTVDQPWASPSPSPFPSPSAGAVRATSPPVRDAAVETRRAKIRLEGGGGEQDRVQQALDVEGVTFATALELGDLPVAGEQGTTTVAVAAVDIDGFRGFTPKVTADAVDVWQRIAEGDAAFTHDVGKRLALALGSRVRVGESALEAVADSTSDMAQDSDGVDVGGVLGARAGAAADALSREDTLRVGAYASNGVPPVADAIVSRATGDELGLDGGEAVLVAIAEDADAQAIAAALTEATGMRAEVIPDPETRRAFLTGANAKDAFEPFSYIDNGDGTIQMDPEWVRRNIVSAEVPIFRGNVVCHRLLVPQLRGALQEVADAGLADLIDPSQYGGCWVARHIDWNPGKPLSMHAWGLAVDFNVSTNQLGAEPQLDPRIVEIFDRWGFVWGGRWSRPDGMHFELGAVLDSPEG
ncbi:MAG: M15 family metallopeptidase [Egibacteraceae bacterium]